MARRRALCLLASLWGLASAVDCKDGGPKFAFFTETALIGSTRPESICQTARAKSLETSSGCARIWTSCNVPCPSFAPASTQGSCNATWLDGLAEGPRTCALLGDVSFLLFLCPCFRWGGRQILPLPWSILRTAIIKRYLPGRSVQAAVMDCLANRVLAPGLVERGLFRTTARLRDSIKRSFCELLRLCYSCLTASRLSKEVHRPLDQDVCHLLGPPLRRLGRHALDPIVKH